MQESKITDNKVANKNLDLDPVNQHNIVLHCRTSCTISAM